MTGLCKMCSKPHPVPLFEGLCKWHKREADKARKSLAPVAKKSDLQKEKDKVYKVLADAHKAKFPICQAALLGCTKATEHVHHMAGRVGAKLTDSSLFLAVCFNCHRQIEESPAKAKALGLSVSRLSVDNQ